MKTHKTLSIAILLAVLVLLTGFRYLNTQEEPVVTLLRLQVGKFFINKPFEKVYVHIDKPFYKPGEDIWFKAYLTMGDRNKPSRKSDIIYVELINPKGTVEKKLTLQALSGICFGTFNLDESAPGGIYKLRAYSNWMSNFGDDYVFEKEIQVQHIVYPRLLFKFDFEKENYSPGDSVKVQLKVETLSNLPLTFQTVEADISYQGLRTLTLKLKTDNKGKLTIAFKLPEDLKSNDGIINARILHQGSTESNSRSIPIVLNNISINFYPEGGTLVVGAPANIAFQALNEFGKPADIEGYVTNSNNKPIAHLSSYHQGMGSFQLTPEDGESYFVYITKPAIRSKFALPKADKSGYSLQVQPMENGKYKAIIFAPENEKMHLVVQSDKNIVYAHSFNSKKSGNSIEYSSNDFPVGISSVSLFDNNGLVRCERLVFFNYQKKLNIKLNFSKQTYLPREKVELQVQTTDDKDKPVAANFSLSVINDQLFTFADDKQHTINTWLLAGAEIKGKIHEPRFYFDPDEPKAEKALDYLLLVQGWRRYNWTEITNSNYSVPFESEKVGDISGKVIDIRNRKPVQAEVIAMELSNLKRILKVKTGSDGKFSFLNADASSALQILANSEKTDAKYLTIELNPANNGNNQFNAPDNKQNLLVPEVIKVKAYENEKEKSPADKQADFQQKQRDAGSIAEGEDLRLEPDILALDECVVIGYGTLKKSDLTGSISVINNEILANDMGVALQGRVAGLEVIQNNGAPGAVSQIRIRGVSSIANNSNPLYIIDGVLFDPNISGVSSPIQNLSGHQIKSIEILKDASSTSIYGSRGANGVILIETTGSGYYSKTILKKKEPKYTGVLVSPRNLSCTKEFYFPVYENEAIPEIRSDFRSTIYWNPNINTNEQGKATLEFYNSDEITSFRAIAEGIGKNGLIGRSEEKYAVQMPFSLAAKFPAYLTFNDTVLMPLIVKNNTSEIIRGEFSFIVPQHFTVNGELPGKISISANEAFTLWLPMVVNNIAGKDSVQVFFNSEKYSDAFKQAYEIQPKGFPVKLGVSGKEMNKNFSFVINKPISGSIHAEFIAFSDIINDLLSGVESILSEPYGCFEQTSSSTYPNIMVLKYLQETESNDKEVMNRAKELIKKGYNRLTGFETAEHGYEWFGGVPAHNGLTAYGLMEFTDMSEVWSGVDKSMLDRTLNKLLSQRDGKGGFYKDTKALDQFGRASEAVTNAYLVYALSQSGVKNLDKEYMSALNEALKSRDPYRLALVANSAYNLNKQSDAEKLMDILQAELSKKGWNEIPIEQSITCSYGKSLKVESASLYALALLKSPDKDWGSIENTIKYIVSSREFGGFGSTQATILALKALTEFASLSKQTPGSGDISLIINGKNAFSIHYEKGDKGKIVINSLGKFLKEGENNIRILYTETESPLPFTFGATWNSSTPESDPKCKPVLATSISEKQVKTGETVRLNVQLTNTSKDGLPMTMAVIGIPSGLSVQPWQLKEMQEKRMFDFYEISKNYLVIYYRQMKPKEEIELHFDLKAEIPGVYQAPASTSYLYYTNELKHWVDGEQIQIVN